MAFDLVTVMVGSVLSGVVGVEMRTWYAFSRKRQWEVDCVVNKVSARRMRINHHGRRLPTFTDPILTACAGERLRKPWFTSGTRPTLLRVERILGGSTVDARGASLGLGDKGERAVYACGKAMGGRIPELSCMGTRDGIGSKREIRRAVKVREEKI